MNVMQKPSSNFTVIQNDIFDNYPDMSAKSKFMLLQILSKPADWKLSLPWLAKQNNEGIHAVRSAVQEWEGRGFLHRFTIRINGRIKEVEPVICYPPLTREQAKVQFNKAYPEIKQTRRCPNRQEELPLEVAQDIIDETEEITPSSTDATNIYDQGICHQVSNIKETAPIIKTDIKQTLRETTTTRAREAEPVICDQVLSLPSSSPSNEILNLIPEKHQTPVVLSLVNKAIVDYPEREVKEAVAYTAGNVRGGSMQFKAYLDKTLKNKWAEGYLDTMENDPFAFEVFGAGQFPNGFTTGSKRQDANLAACLEFAAYSMGQEVTA